MISRSSVETKSKTNQVQSNFRASLKEELNFEIEIKRQSRLVSKWKKRNCFIMYLPNQQLSLTIKSKDKNDSTQQIINLRNTKISKRCSVVENHHCFGLQISTGKRYLISRQTQSKTLVLFDNIVRLRKYFKQKSSEKDKQTSQQSSQKNQQMKLEFERSNILEDYEEKQKIQEKYPKFMYTTPIKQEYSKQQKEEMKEKPQLIQQEENYEDYRTAMEEEEEPLPIIDEEPEIHLKVPLTSKQLSYLENDQGFKLCENFNEGRLLQKNSVYLKSNLILKTHLNQFQLLQSYFHLQLWNDKVAKYQVLNRIDEGIYLVYLQLKKKYFFSRNHYCYLMATSITIDTEPCLILKSLNKSDFDKVQGCQWIDLTIWTKVRGLEDCNLQKCLTSCLKVQDSSWFQEGYTLMNQVKRFQSFLYTTYTLPFKMLEWRKEGKIAFLE